MQDRTAEMDAKLAGQTDLAGFRDVARKLLAHQVLPADVQWVIAPDDPFTLDPPSALASRPAACS